MRQARGTGLPLVYSVPSQSDRVVFGSPSLGCSEVRPLMFGEKSSELPWKGCVHQASAFCQVSKSQAAWVQVPALPLTSQII